MKTSREWEVLWEMKELQRLYRKWAYQEKPSCLTK